MPGPLGGRPGTARGREESAPYSQHWPAGGCAADWHHAANAPLCAPHPLSREWCAGGSGCGQDCFSNFAGSDFLGHALGRLGVPFTGWARARAHSAGRGRRCRRPDARRRRWCRAPPPRPGWARPPRLGPRTGRRGRQAWRGLRARRTAVRAGCAEVPSGRRDQGLEAHVRTVSSQPPLTVPTRSACAHIRKTSIMKPSMIASPPIHMTAPPACRSATGPPTRLGAARSSPSSACSRCRAPAR